MKRLLLPILILIGITGFAQTNPSYRSVLYKLQGNDSSATNSGIGTYVEGKLFFNPVSKHLRLYKNGAFVTIAEGSSGSAPSELLNEYFNGTGAQTAFVLSQAGTVYQVEVAGQVMQPSTDYSVAGQTVTLTFAPAVGQTIGIYYFTDAAFASVARQYGAACSDLTTALTTGTNKAFLPFPQSFTITSVRAELLTAQSSGTILTVDINKNGTTILSTKLTIDNNETTSLTATTPAVISNTAIANDDRITFDIDAVGLGGLGLIVWIIGY